MEADDAIRLVQRIYTRLNARRNQIETWEDYFNGKQPLSFATEEWRKSNGQRYVDFSDNWCAPVVNATAERIRYEGIKVPGFKKAGKQLHEQWMINEMDMQSSQGVLQTLTTGRSFVIVWGDRHTDEPIITWEHPSSVEIEYDWENPRIRKAALKTWADEKHEFATLYTPEHIWKFQRLRAKDTTERDSQADQARVPAVDAGGWEMREVGMEAWPLVNPLGVVPVVEVPNRPTLLGNPVSEIQGVVPMQDAINLLWAYMFLAADYASMPARVVLQSTPPRIPVLDKDGKQIDTKSVDMKELSEKRLFYVNGDKASIDSWEAARLDVFTDTIEIAVGHIAAQTRTPPTYLVTNKGISNVNGDGLKASEIGLNKKVGEFHLFASPPMREINRLIALVQAKYKLAQQIRLASVEWMNPEIRSEAQLADSLVKLKQIGFPFEYIAELYGMSPQQVDRVLAMRADELNDPQIIMANRELTVLADSPDTE